MRYSEMGKIALSLVNAARRLRPYFLNHTIIVRTDHPLSSILGKADTSGRLVKWAIELEQFDIHYESRTAIKAHALADFIQETTRDVEEKEWELYIDGSATKQGAAYESFLSARKRASWSSHSDLNLRPRTTNPNMTPYYRDCTSQRKPELDV